MRLSNCEFCQKRDFQIVNFVKNEIFNTHMNFWTNREFLPQCVAEAIFQGYEEQEQVMTKVSMYLS